MRLSLGRPCACEARIFIADGEDTLENMLATQGAIIFQGAMLAPQGAMLFQGAIVTTESMSLLDSV